MKTYVTILGFALLLLGAYSFKKMSATEFTIKESYSKSHINRFTSGPPTGRTGAPGEGNCTGCHSGTVNSPSSINALSLFEEGTTTLVTEYEPGKTYDAVIEVTALTTKRGFQTTARILSSNLTAGNLSAVAGSTALQTSSGKQYVNHVSASTTAGPTFSFKWTAPATDEGDVRFYVASNVTNANGSSSGDQIHLSEFTFSRKLNPPVADFTSDVTNLCSGASVSFTDASTGTPASYNWIFQGGTPGTSTDPNPVVSYTSAGTFDVSLTVTNADGSNQKTEPAHISVNPNPVIALGIQQNPLACGDASGSVEVTGSGSGTVSWTGTLSGNSGNTTLPFIISNLTAGNYSISFDDACLSNTENAALSDPGAPATPTVSSSDADNSVCDGDSVVLSSSSSIGNVWSNGETSQTIVLKSSANISVMVIETGCSSASSTPINVTVNPIPAKPVITSSDPDNIICETGGSLVLTATPASSYQWSNGELTQQITVTTAGIFSVFVLENDCASPMSDTVLVSTEFCVGLEENQIDLVVVYPNPGNEQLSIKGKALVHYTQLKCVDNQGKIVATWDFEAQNEWNVDVSQIASGTYQLKCSGNDGVAYRTIRIQH